MDGDWNHVQPHHVYADDHYYGTYTPDYLLHENIARFGYFLQGYMIYCYQLPVDPGYSYDARIAYRYRRNQPSYHLFNNPALSGTYPIPAQEVGDDDDDHDDQNDTLFWEDLDTFEDLEEVLIWDLLDEDDIDEYLDYESCDGLSEEIIVKHLKTRSPEYDEDEDEDEDEICVVCQDCLMHGEDKIGTLDCGHEYHEGCIKTWLMNKNRCPLCKATGISRLQS